MTARHDPERGHGPRARQVPKRTEPIKYLPRCQTCGHHRSEHLGEKGHCCHRLKQARGCPCQSFHSPPDKVSISTQDNLYGYRVETTPTGARATCLQTNCAWTLTLETGTVRVSFTGADSRARQHYHEAHEPHKDKPQHRRKGTQP